MARLLIAAALLAMTAGTARAADQAADDDVVAAAAEAGIEDITLLQGALNSQPGVGAREYLIFDGKIEPPVPPAPPLGVWDRLAMCESGGNWATNTGNNYYGGIQFDLQTWRAYGGVGFPHQASRATQIAVAERLRAARGYQPWPVCSRRVGLR